MTRTEVASSHLDTVRTRRKSEQKPEKREPARTIQEAARRCGVSDQTIQRAIRAGTTPARYPQPNRCEIAVSDLERILPGHVQTATKQDLAEHVSGHVQAEMEQRVVALEQRVQKAREQMQPK
jgi:predicted site-specific integrase-resolvase